MASKTDNNIGNDDDWETDPDYVNDVSEQTQRWGGRQREAGRFLFGLRQKIDFNNMSKGYSAFLKIDDVSFLFLGAIDMDKFRKDILKEDEEQHKKKVENIGQAKGYQPVKDDKEKGNK